MWSQKRPNVTPQTYPKRSCLTFGQDQCWIATALSATFSETKSLWNWINTALEEKMDNKIANCAGILLRFHQWSRIRYMGTKFAGKETEFPTKNYSYLSWIQSYNSGYVQTIWKLAMGNQLTNKVQKSQFVWKKTNCSCVRSQTFKPKSRPWKTFKIISSYNRPTGRSIFLCQKLRSRTR